MSNLKGVEQLLYPGRRLAAREQDATWNSGCFPLATDEGTNVVSQRDTTQTISFPSRVALVVAGPPAGGPASVSSPCSVYRVLRVSDCSMGSSDLRRS